MREFILTVKFYQKARKKDFWIRVWKLQQYAKSIGFTVENSYPEDD